MPTPSLTDYIRSGYAGLVLHTHEDSRADLALMDAVRTLGAGWRIRTWSCTNGLCEVDISDGTAAHTDRFEDPIPVLELLSNPNTIPDQTVLIMHDMHRFLEGAPPMFVPVIKKALASARARQVCLVFPMPVLHTLPPDLEKLLTVIDLPLPSRDELQETLANLCDPESGRHMPTGDHLAALLDAAAGLTLQEAENAFALSLLQDPATFDPQVVFEAKITAIKTNGLAEYIPPSATLDDIGGWDLYKADLHHCRLQFTPAAAAYGLIPRKGVLLVGQGGTGKSLSAPVTATVLGLPCLRVRADALKGGIVGQTEKNWRTVVKIARSLGKCAVYVDEIDGATAGAASSGHTDGGTTISLVKAILQDIQESTGLFFIFTANDLDHIPDPLIDRLDVWSVELPNAQEREEIFAIHIRKCGRDPRQFNLTALGGTRSEGFSGRQIERAWHAALAKAFHENAREPTTQDILDVLASMVPTATTMAAAIESRRQRLQGKARPVTSPPKPSTASLLKARKIAA